MLNLAKMNNATTSPVHDDDIETNVSTTTIPLTNLSFTSKISSEPTPINAPSSASPPPPPQSYSTPLSLITCHSPSGTTDVDTSTSTDISSTPITPNDSQSSPTLSTPIELASHPPKQANAFVTTETDIDADTSTTVTEPTNSRKIKECKLVRKIDRFMFPVLLAMCMFQAVDRGAIGIAKINGIQDDLQMTHTQFNLSLSIFQTGYMLFQIPSNLLVVHPKIHPGIYLALTCLAWSTVGLSHAFVQSYTQLLVVRFLLGVFDAPYFVGAAFLLSCWYTRREMAMRLAVLLVGLIFMMTFLGPIAAGIIGGLDGVNGWRGWRWVYICFGSVGVGVAVWGWLMLPGCALERGQDGKGGKRRVWWLSEEEYELAKRRIQEDRVGEKRVEKGKIWIGFKLAVKDVRTWVFVVMILTRKSFDGLWNYELSILKSLHLVRSTVLSEDTATLLLSVGPAMFAGFITLFTAYSSDRHSERSWHMIGPLLFALIGLTVCAATLNPVVRYAMMFLFEAGELSGVAMAWAWVTSTIQETPEKKAIAIAIVNVLGGMGAICGPFFFREEDEPGYRMAFGILAGCVVVDAGSVLLMRHLLSKANRMLEEMAATESESSTMQKYSL